MERAKFKTNIKCSGCIEKVTPGLNNLYGEGGWEVDLQSAEKWLTLSAENPDIEKLQSTLGQVGYKAEKPDA